MTHHIHKAKSEGCNFMYHMDNDCYKSFTLKRKIDAALKKRKREELQGKRCARKLILFSAFIVRED